MAHALTAFSTDAIRASERPILENQSYDDELMMSAASAVARAAQSIVMSHPLVGRAERILVLAGAGGNGGDGLYAGAALARSGYAVDALLLGRNSRVHEPAFRAFREAGGFVVESVDPTRYVLVIDAILGIGGSGGLSDEVAYTIAPLRHVFTLSVDVPSGINANTGEAGEHHITANATITFGGLRYAHGLTTACGEVLLADARTTSARLSRELARQATRPRVTVSRVWDYDSGISWDESIIQPGVTPLPQLEPRPDDDKYSGGVVGIAAGSTMYPGAAVLTTTAAVRATPSMVRYAGPQADNVVSALPEVVVTNTIADAGRVQAWVFGPGSGTNPEPLQELLATEVPLLIDADGLTLLASHPHLREMLSTRAAYTALTPHAGEARRLLAAVDKPDIDPATDRLAAVRTLADAYRCTVLLKGRFTAIANEETTMLVDTASSWAATPGSGDVLSGLAGAYLAHAAVTGADFRDALAAAVSVHATAAYLAASTPYGMAPTSASRIAGYVPAAYAYLSQ